MINQEPTIDEQYTIVILSRGYPTANYPMNGIFEFDQAKALVAAGCKVVFAVVDLRSIRRTRKWGYEKLCKEGVEIRAINIPLGRLPKAVLSLAGKIGGQFIMKKILAEFGKPKILHAHFTGQGLIGGYLKKKHGIPLIITEHSSTMAEIPIQPEQLRRATKAYSQADKLIVVSPALQKTIKSEVACDSTYIPNVIDTGTFSFTKKESVANFAFFTAGSLIPRKGMDVTIKAFNEVIKTYPHARLRIVGEGPERKNLEALITSLNLHNKVELLGFCDRKVIAKEMQEAKCFVLASKAETFGVVYVEAMTTGTPVIATKCQGPEHLITTKNGLLVAVDDHVAVAHAMITMITNYKQYDLQKISSEAINSFSPTAISKRLLMEYNEFLL